MTSFPAVHQDIAVVLPEVTAAAVRATVLAAGGELLRCAEVFDLYEGEQLGAGRRASPCGSSSGPPTAPSPTRRSRGCAMRSRPSWRRSGGRSVAEHAPQPIEASPRRGSSSPAPPASPAPSPPSSSGATRGSSWSRPPRAATPARRLDRLYPRYRVPIELTELDLDSLEEVDAAIVAYPHGASAPTVAALRGLGALVVDLSADFRLRDLPTYERWYGEHGAPELLEGAVYGLTELYRDELREAELVATPGCYPTASVLALAPLAERGLIADAVIDANAGHLRLPGAAATTPSTSPR